MTTAHYLTAKACALYNRVTNPAKLRTEAEHARCDRAARRVRRWLFKNARKGIHFREMDSGRLYPIG